LFPGPMKKQISRVSWVVLLKVCASSVGFNS
jgi:hypothetical protein